MHKHEPCPLPEIEKTYPEDTICQMHRDIYALTDKEEIKLLARRALSAGKAMSARLKMYRELCRRVIEDDEI